MLTESQNQRLLQVMSRYHPTVLGYFGSHARGEQTAHSDLDVLVDFDPPLDLITLIGLEQELSEGLGIHVDLVTARSLHPLIRKSIEKDLILLDA